MERKQNKGLVNPPSCIKNFPVRASSAPLLPRLLSCLPTPQEMEGQVPQKLCVLGSGVRRVRLWPSLPSLSCGAPRPAIQFSASLVISIHLFSKY